MCIQTACEYTIQIVFCRMVGKMRITDRNTKENKGSQTESVAVWRLFCKQAYGDLQT